MSAKGSKRKTRETVLRVERIFRHPTHDEEKEIVALLVRLLKGTRVGVAPRANGAPAGEL